MKTVQGAMLKQELNSMINDWGFGTVIQVLGLLALENAQDAEKDGDQTCAPFYFGLAATLRKAGDKACQI